MQRRIDLVVDWHVARGYQVLHETDTRTNLVRPKRFSLGWALAWFLVFGFGLLVYLAYYLSKKDESIVLFEEEGQIIRVPPFTETERLQLAEHLGEDPLEAPKVGGLDWDDFAFQFGRMSVEDKISEWARLTTAQRRRLTGVYGYRNPAELEN